VSAAVLLSGNESRRENWQLDDYSPILRRIQSLRLTVMLYYRRVVLMMSRHLSRLHQRIAALPPRVSFRETPCHPILPD
jgi:hypothetical protein